MTGAHDIYPFSLHPVRVVEFVWPNVYGNPFHGNRSGSAPCPARTPDVKLWVPTLYLGGLTLVLALGGLGTQAGGQARSLAELDGGRGGGQPAGQFRRVRLPDLAGERLVSQHDCPGRAPTVPRRR